MYNAKQHWLQKETRHVICQPLVVQIKGNCAPILKVWTALSQITQLVLVALMVSHGKCLACRTVFYLAERTGFLGFWASGGNYKASTSNTQEEECKKITPVCTPLFTFRTPPLAWNCQKINTCSEGCYLVCSSMQIYLWKIGARSII